MTETTGLCCGLESACYTTEFLSFRFLSFDIFLVFRISCFEFERATETPCITMRCFFKAPYFGREASLFHDLVISDHGRHCGYRLFGAVISGNSKLMQFAGCYLYTRVHK